MTELESSLADRIEEASLNAWPAMRQMLMDGWVLRFSRGFTKRSNSIIPLYPSAAKTRADILAKVRYCENLYAREQLQTVFRLTSLQESSVLVALLEQRGYRKVEPSVVLHLALQDAAGAPDTAHQDFKILPLEEWLGVYCQLTGMDEPTRTLHRLILNSITGECCFSALFSDGEPVACGVAVVERELVGLFDIFTAPSARRRGYAGYVVQGLLNWAKERGAAHAYLQVVADNDAAIALYEPLGFARRYHYHYYVN